MNKLMKILDNCGETIKKIAGFCFLFFIVIAVAYFALGYLNILSAISIAQSPEILITPIPPAPRGVDMAAIVWDILFLRKLNCISESLQKSFVILVAD